MGRSGDVREAALTLFAERGYHGTTMNDIAGALGIRAPSLYNHITSKQEILREIIIGTMDRVLADFEAATSGVDDVADRLRRATEAYVLRHARYRREALVVNRETHSLESPARSVAHAKQDEYARRFQDLIEEGRAAERFHVKSPRLATFAILEMAVAVARWFRDEGPLSATEVAEEYGEFALRIVGFSVSPADVDLGP
jgi:AcrR family transcriptional regulator